MSATENQKIIEFSELKIDDEIFFGTSDSMQEVKKRVDKVAPTEILVLITGEPGVGKEVIAEAIHKSSPRKNKPFKAVNCAAFHDGELLQSELFGHEKGAFTNATSMHKGVFEQADGGTLFLDEVGDMSPRVQAALLRVLETQKITRLMGKVDAISVDVRIIAATNVDLEAAVLEKKFRQDLYDRVKRFSIPIPPLRERREDIPHFVEMFVSKFDEEYSQKKTNWKHFTHITEEALSSLKKYDWPGNVRELKDISEFISAFNSQDKQLQLKHVEEGFEYGRIKPQDPLPIKDPKIESRKGPPGLFNEILGLLNTWNTQKDSPLKPTDTEITWSRGKLRSLAAYYLHQQPTWIRWTQKELLEACDVNRSTYSKFKEEFEAHRPDFRQNVLARIQEEVASPENSDGEENGSPDT